ncbi:MAG: efflux RND transporter periplasmic adaptor subunit [Ferruginibacter sp.]
MKKLLMLPVFCVTSVIGMAHGDEDHAAKPAMATGVKYHSSEALSDKYEVLIKYGELPVNKPSAFLLFLSDAKTNRALDSAFFTIKIVGKPNIQFKISRSDTGIYKIEGIFPAKDSFDLQINIKGTLGADFLQVPKIVTGKKLTEDVETEHAHWYSSPWLWAAGGLLTGLFLMYFVMNKRNRKIITVALIIGLLVPTAVMNPTSAHGDDDHGAGGKGGGVSNTFIVEKETQFLFDILTQKTGEGNFLQSTEIAGTVIASPQGMAVIQSPQTGKIVSLRVTPGQKVSKGQTLATIEQQVEAGTQIDIISQRNSLNAEAKAAKVQYDRLKSIADIAAKKDVTEAKARYEAAVQNLALFNSNIGGGASTKMVSLFSPISGIVGTFNYAIGAVVSTGQTLFEITNLYKVYVETQVFATGSTDSIKANRYVAFSANDTTTYSLKMVSTAQSVNTQNQSQKVLFEIINPAGKFKIGENVRVLKYGTAKIMQLVIPTSAIVDINGKPGVFIKDKAERFSVSIIQKGESNALYTAILKGAEAGERVVTANVYQMKMIYLGQ